MTAHRREAVAATLTASTAFLIVAAGAGPAAAHGAPVSPVSRASACAPQLGLVPSSAACREAAARRGRPFNDWDNIRVAGVAGRDRQVIPDGKLCSGGRAEFGGLDQPRADWPTTRLAPGARISLRYSSTIPHEGEFRVYLSKPGYNPAKPLTWSEIPRRPFAAVRNPPLAGGAYHIRGRLPADRTGRQMLLTVWQNTSTADTYYSCSDVVFPEDARGQAAGGGTGKRSEASSGTAAGRQDSGVRQPSGPTAPTPASTVPASGADPKVPPAARGGRHPEPADAQAAADSVVQGESVSGGGSEIGVLLGGAGAAALAAGVLVGTAALRRRRA
jgi:predicted carbohydrate-binding protein with CBM5 and CBM33 domain